MRTSKEIRREFRRLGISVSKWAKTHGFSPVLVYQVMSGSRKALRGESHRIAVTLGLKEGDTGEISDLAFERDLAKKAKTQAME